MAWLYGLAAISALGLAGAAPAETIHVIERATSDRTAHVGPAPDNAGDILTFANDVFDAANSVRIGTDQGYCIRIAPGKSYECAWTLFLEGGQITVAGPFLDAVDSTLAVTGGTGRYAGAKGEMALHDHDGKGGAYDFIYRLTTDR